MLEAQMCSPPEVCSDRGALPELPEMVQTPSAHAPDNVHSFCSTIFDNQTSTPPDTAHLTHHKRMNRHATVYASTEQIVLEDT